MTDIGAGFDQFADVCRELGVVAKLGEPASDVPQSLFGQSLEETLVQFYRNHDGGWWSAPQFDLRVYPLEGADSLEWRNASIRRAEEGADAYPYGRLLTFAQYGRRAAYLATVPSTENNVKRQPIVFLDDSETPWAVPIASSLDGAFKLLAAYLRSASAKAGLAGVEEISFPLEVSELIAADDALRRQVRSGDLDAIAGDDASIRDWITNTFA